MSQPFVGEIRIFGFNFAPINWALCQGQLLPISQYSALFSLLGTNFGGNGTSNFGLPNLQGNVAPNYGQGPGLSDYFLGETGGTQTVTLTTQQLPQHNHSMNAANIALGSGFTATPSHTTALNHSDKSTGYVSPGTPAVMSPAAIGPQGGNLPHNNMMPYMAMYYCIALSGYFPQRP